MTITRSRWRAPAAALLLPLLAAAPLATPTAAAPDRQKVIIVLDSSGSMAGKIRGRRKIDIARGVIRDLLKSWSPKTDLGLIAYGHRRKGSCSDIQTIYKVGKADRRQVMKSVNRLRPRGKTPLGASVLRAAKALKYTEEKATVILVSDGRENCGIDPCRLGRELEKNGVDFTAHVIGFKLRRGEDKGLRCLAEATGGRYFAANDSRQLSEALRESVKEVEKAPPPKPKPAKPEPKPVVAKGNVAMDATYTKGGAVIKSPNLRWTISRIIRIKGALGTKERIKRDWLGSRYNRKGAEPVWTLEPGEYEVKVVLGNASATAIFTVEKGGTVKQTVNLDAGAFRMTATYVKGGEPITSKRLAWTISRVIRIKGELGSKPKEKIDWMGSGTNRRGPSAMWLLNAGEYVVTFRLGNARRAIRFTVKAGDEGSMVANLDAGAFKMSAVYAKGGDPITSKSLAWTISRVIRAKGELGSKSKEKIDWMGSGTNRRGGAPVWLLNAGEYVVTFKMGNAQREVRFIVKAGEEGSKTVSLEAGTAKLTAVDKDGKPVAGEKLAWTVSRVVRRPAEPGRKAATRIDWMGSGANRRGQSPVWLLNAGEYEITLKVGKTTVKKRITVKAAGDHSFTLVLSI